MNKRMKLLAPLKAIRANCLDGSGGSSAEVRLCVIPKCPLCGYRFGSRPKTVQKANERRRVKKTRAGVEKSAPEAKPELTGSTSRRTKPPPPSSPGTRAEEKGVKPILFGTRFAHSHTPRVGGIARFR